MADADLTRRVKERARDLGADLVGVAPVARWAKAPLEHSPQGVFPGARSVVVCGIHFLDACTELGAEDDPREPGPALTEMNASAALQHLAYWLAKFIQDSGWRAIQIRQSGAWSYRPREGAERGWIGDICSYYAAVCAGLGEIGWNNLCLTPEFGPRQRFVPVITDAPLAPDPLYEGEPLCDRCGLCAKRCPTRCFEKDASGKMLSIEVDGRRFEFPDRNLWRCAIGENFQLDVFLPWEEEVDERLVLEMEEKALRERREWVKGWKMGMCLKHCVPPQRRYFDAKYCKAPRRRRDVSPDEGEDRLKELMDDLEAIAAGSGVDLLASAPAEDLARRGIDLASQMPDARSGIVIGLGFPERCYLNSNFLAVRAELMLAKHIQEKYGFSALTRPAADVEEAALAAGLAREADESAPQASAPTGRDAPTSHWRVSPQEGKALTEGSGARQIWRLIATAAPLGRERRDPSPALILRDPSPYELTARIREAAFAEGADLVGIAPAKRLEEAAESLRAAFAEDDGYFVVEDRGWPVEGENIWSQGQPYNPEARDVAFAPKTPSDHLEGARSVIVVGLRMLEASVDEAGKPPALKAGHYHSAVHEEALNQLSSVLLKAAKLLDANGFRAAPSFDLTGLASMVYGGGVDLTASRFAAVAAGLGEIGWGGLVLTPEFGARQRFACLVTDAELDCDGVYDGRPLCTRCRRCAETCAVGAISKERALSVEIGGREFSWGALDRLRCDCAKRYALVAEEGPAFVGSTNDFEPPDRITREWVVEAVRASDRLQRPGYCPIVERCLARCPAHVEGPPQDVAFSEDAAVRS
jgi:epoxyqueuosine reductase QueG